VFKSFEIHARKGVCMDVGQSKVSYFARCFCY